MASRVVLWTRLWDQTAGLIGELLSRDDGHIPGLQAWRRGDDQGRVDLGKFPHRGRRQVLAVHRPVPVQFCHPYLQVLALLRR